MASRDKNGDDITDKDIEKYIIKQNVPSKYKDSARKLIKNMIAHECYKNENYKWSIDDFELSHRMGRGRFGRVFCAREKKAHYIVAIKTMEKKEIVKAHVEKQVMREIEIQSHLNHPNVLRLLTWFHDDFRIYLVLEFAGQGELYVHLKNSPNGHFSEHLAAKYTYQVADALHYCHKNNVIHRDIKPENLLLTITGDIKVADFGWSVHAPSGRRKTTCGTIDYLAPELVESRDHGHHVDQWCLGILCYEFLIGSPPFESDKTEETYRKICNINLQFPESMPKGAADLISKLLIYDMKKRLPLPQVMKHYWIVANKDKP